LNREEQTLLTHRACPIQSQTTSCLSRDPLEGWIGIKLDMSKFHPGLAASELFFLRFRI
jgi:hypothetical protein